MRQRVEDNAFHFKIAPWVSEHTANGQRAEFIVVRADRVDLSAAAPLTTKVERAVTYTKRCETRARRRRHLSCNGYASAASSIALFTSLTQSW